ncbi:MAG: ImmA/IrrE family metallo-endopeptidase [Vulcanimicrobiota bacterium]
MEIDKKIRNSCAQYRFLEELLRTNSYTRFPEEPIDSIRRKCDVDNLAVKISNLLKLGDRPAYSLQKILEFDHGVKILFYPFSEGSAVSLVDPDIGYVIVVNSNEAPWRRNYDIAHELFHLMTWKATVQQCQDKEQCSGEIEGKAERFASVLLLPEGEVRKEINERIASQGEITHSDISDIAQSFGISVQALCYRMAHLNFIKWEKAHELAQDKELLQTCRRKRVKEKQAKPEPERFYSLAVRCLRKGLISRGRFAEIVEIDRYDIDKFIEDRGLMASEGNKVEIMAAGC